MGKIIKQVNDFKYLGSYVVSTDHDVNVSIGQAWSALNIMTSIWKSHAFLRTLLAKQRRNDQRSASM